MRPQHAEEWYRKHLFHKKANQKLYDAALAAYKQRTKEAARAGSQLALLMPHNRIQLGRGHRVSRPPKQFEVSKRNPCTLVHKGVGMFGHVGHVWACLGMFGHVWACLGMFGHV